MALNKQILIRFHTVGRRKLPRGMSGYTGFFDPIEIMITDKLDLLI